MKKTFYIFCFAMMVMGACTKQLNQVPPSSLIYNNFFSNTTDFQQGIAGVYNKLRAYPDQQLWMGEMRSDNVSPTSDGNRDWQGINDFSPNLTTTAFIISAYNNDFSGIYNANTVLDALAGPKANNIPDTTLRNRFGAECRFLRALYYFDLLRFYGKVPIIDKLMTPAQVLAIPRSPIADIYTFIVSDLKYAIANLPVSYASADIGRPTSWAAKGMLGLVYLTKSGPLYSGVDGPTLNSGEYNLALAQFNDIITNGPYVFSPTYPSIFSYTNENNKEVLFDVQFASTTNGADYPSMLVPSAYWSGLGLSNYGNGYGTTSFNTTKNLMYSYRASAAPGTTDKRDTSNILHAWATATTTPTVLDTTRPFIKKYINVALKGTAYTDWPINFIVMRYTDILMMKAECILHGATGTQTDVDAIVNQVRARAGVPALTNVSLATLMEERRREFLGEGLRWNDLVREGMAVTTMNAWIASDSMTTISKVIPNYIIYPIPQEEILVKQGLYIQNPGYN